MRNVFTNTKKVILMVAMMATVMGYANEISVIKFGKNLKGTALTIDNVKEGNQLSIKDGYGIILYREIIEQNGMYTKGFDLTDLPNGDYFFELEKDLEIQTIPFSVQSNIVTFNKEKETITFKPFIREENGLVYVTKLAPKAEPLKISIYGLYSDNNPDDMLYTETIKDTQNIERIFKLEKGHYKIVFQFENKEITKYIDN